MPKISELVAAGTLVGTEPIPTVQTGVTVRTTPDAISTASSWDAADLVLYVSLGSKASDSNDGLSPGQPKATVAGALAAGARFVQLGLGTFPCEVTPPSGTRFSGLGVGLTTLRLPNSSAVGYVIGATSAVSDVTISDLTIDGNKANQATTGGRDGIRFLHGTRISVRNVHVKDCKEDGVYLSGCIDPVVEGVLSEDNGRNGFSCGAAAATPTVNPRFIGCTSKNHLTAGSIGMSLEPAIGAQVIGFTSVGDYDGVVVQGVTGLGDSEDNYVEATVRDYRGRAIVIGPQDRTRGTTAFISAHTTQACVSGADVGDAADYYLNFRSRGSVNAASTTAAGIRSDAGGQRFTIDAEINGAGGYGIALTGAAHGVVRGFVRNASQAAAGIRDGVLLTNCLDMRVESEVYDDQVVKTTNWGIRVTGAVTTVGILTHGSHVHDVLQPAGISIDWTTAHAGAMKAAGEIATAQPTSNGRGEWRLGKAVPAVAALDTTGIVEVEIDGVIVKLAKATT